MTAPQPSALALRSISKRFGALVALDCVSLDVRRGTVHALLGENGAGKTTLMRVAFGMVRPDEGTIHVSGRRESIHSPADAIAAGIGMVHQHFTLVPAMSVAENIALGGRGLLRKREMTAKVAAIAELTGFALEASAVVERLSVGAQQRVEIAKALAHGTDVLVLDEPSAALAPAETDDLLRWMRRFADAGHAVVLITHKLADALAVADDVTVLRNGRAVHTGPASSASAQSLTAAMLGQEGHAPDAVAATQVSGGGPIVLRAHDITLRDEQGRERLRHASLEVRAGEIIGVAGVEGAGHRELLRALAGRGAVVSGRIERPDRIGFVPEDRHRDAMLLERSLTENVALRNAGRRRGRIHWRALQTHTESLIGAFDVRASSPGASMRTLSGGNQQKLVLAREMTEEDPDRDVRRPSRRDVPASALIVENPTRGLDVRATNQVHSRLRAARDVGTAIVIYSTDLDEVLALATRVVVAFAGTLREVPIDRGAIGRAMLGLE